MDTTTITKAEKQGSPWLCQGRSARTRNLLGSQTSHSVHTTDRNSSA